jgi:putative resolvase
LHYVFNSILCAPWKTLLERLKLQNYWGVTVKTLQRWEREKRLIPIARTKINRRLYTTAQIRAFIGLKQTGEKNSMRVIAYCRVSSAAPKQDLINQRRVLEEFTVAKGLPNVEFVEEIGGGLNFKRKKFLTLMDEIGRREIKILPCSSRSIYSIRF